MSRLYSKKYIDNYILSETKGYYILNKDELILREDLRGDAYVEPSTTGTSSSLSNDLNKTRTQNPNADSYVVNPTDYNATKTDDVPDLNIDAENSVDAEKQIKSLNTNPRMSSIINHGDANIKVRFREHLERLRESSVPFTKKEIIEMLKK